VHTPRPPLEKVGARGAKLTRARTGEEEPDTPLLDEELGLVEQLRALRDVVEEHDTIAKILRLDLASEQGRIGEGPEE